MSNQLIASLALVTILLAIINLLPTGRAAMLSCYGGMTHYYATQKTSGIPFTYFKDNPTGNSCYAIDEKTGKDIARGDPKQYDKYTFYAGAFIADAALALGVLGLQYGFLRKRKMSK